MRRFAVAPTVALALAGCGAPSCPAGLAAPALEADVDHAATVWARAPDAPEGCAVAWSAAGLDHLTALSDAGEAALFGAPAGAELTARVRCDDVEGPAASLITGSAPDGLPGFTVDVAPDGLEPRLILSSAMGGGPDGWVTIRDTDGQPVWWVTHTGLGVTHARYDAEAGRVYAAESNADGSEAYLLLAPLAGPDRRIPVPGAHHDSLALGGGRYLMTVGETRTVNGEAVRGDTLVVVDAADGGITPVWSAFDALEVRRNGGWNIRAPDGAADWTHLNGLDRDPDTGAIAASLYWDHAILQLDPATWTVDWALGGPDADLTPDEPFGPQHSPLHRGDTLWMFDNGSDAARGSLLAAYALDPGAGTAVRTWTWAPSPPEFDIALGSIVRDGDTVLASWGDSGRVRMLDAEGQVEAAYDLEGGGVGGYTSFVPAD